MKKSILRCAIAAVLVNAGNATAGGLWLNEYGDFSGGRASAGASSGTDDAATIMHNPASSSRIQEKQLFVSAGVLIPDTKFDVDYTTPRLGTGNGGSAGQSAPGGTMAYVQQFSDRWSGGIYVLGLAGAGLDYDRNWTGRYQGTKVDLLLASVAPTIAYRVTDKLSVGGTLQYWYSNLNIHLAVPTANPAEDARASINGDDTGFSFKLGAMYELTNRTRFGAVYQSKVDPEYDGDLKIKAADGGTLLPEDGLEVASNTEVDFAQTIRLSMHHDLDEHWGLNLTLGWDDWSQLGDIPISTDNRGINVPAKWRDTYKYGWGVQYTLDQHWAFTSGVSYDTNPVNKEDRNAQLPVDRQIRYAVGARYTVRDTLSIGGYINYADLGKARISTDNFGGEYQDNGLLGLSLNANWTF